MTLVTHGSSHHPHYLINTNISYFTVIWFWPQIPMIFEPIVLPHIDMTTISYIPFSNLSNYLFNSYKATPNVARTVANVSIKETRTWRITSLQHFRSQCCWNYDHSLYLFGKKRPINHSKMMKTKTSSKL
jgi:hypothetical protein